MTRQYKAAVLLAVARAYLRRGRAIQYDQLSMDRILRVTPRHQRYAPPEAATEQHTVYEDCACFVNAVYYNTFGCELEGDVTWNIAKLVKPLVFAYCLTKTETTAQRAAIREKVLALLQPGDALLFFKENGYGHILLAGEPGWFYHCTNTIDGDSYHYGERHSCPTAHGDVFKESVEKLFDPQDNCYLMAEDVVRFCVIRPLERMGEPTAAAMARVSEAKDLCCSVYSSHPGGKSAMAGGTAAYTVEIINDGSVSVVADIRFAPAQGTALAEAGEKQVTVGAGEAVRVDFPLTVSSDAPGIVDAPTVSVNGFSLWAERLLVHTNDGSQWELPSESRILTDYFARYDALETGTDVLWRKPQEPRRDGCLYGYFGGIGVITPELMTNETIRTRTIRFCDLCPGDIVLCSDDALFQKTYHCHVTDTGLTGLFSHDGAYGTVTGEAADRFIDTLPGRFCYIVLRPGMKERKRP